ncbi:MDR family MFS transporter [Actinomadura parmotrematis]|uniref:MFS transporter n=1 Tax=Actinomadura parmotrematis TaxID=2864039 RepID=A0ABS7FZI9_9ACTN|nr:MDR family MFS transporter [Actinomadura parmotrematis]MBW8485867.1 MFS transporter [Actinomadura parmotrematis]
MTALAPVPAEAPLPGRRQTLVVFGGLLLALLVVGLDQTTVAVAAPTIVQKLGGLSSLPWVFSANLLAAAAAAPLFGKLSDLYGRRPLFLAALAVFVAGSLACGLAQNTGQLIAFRAVQGVGSGGMTAMVVVVVGALTGPRSRAAYQGYIGAELAVAQVVGPWLGGYLTDHASWRWVFLLNVPVGLAALAIAWLTLRVPRATVRPAIDWLGAALLVGGLASLLLALSWGGSKYAWSSGQVVGLLAAGVALLAAFGFAESRAAEPIVPLAFFRNRVSAVALVLMLLVGMSLFSLTFYMPAMLQIVIGVSATDSGFLVLPLQLGVLATSIASGHAVAATGRYRWWPVAGTVVAAAGVFLLSRISPDTGQATALLFMVVVGLGLGCLVQLLVVVAQNAVDRRDLGSVTASAGLFRILGGAVGAGVFGAILNARLPDAVAAHVPRGALPPGMPVGFLTQNPAQVKKLPPPARTGLAAAFADTFHVIFLAALPLAALAIVAALLLKQIPMRDDAEDAGPAEDAGTVPPAVVED